MNQINNSNMSPSIAENINIKLENDLSNSIQPNEVKVQNSNEKNSPFIIQNGNIYQLNSNNQIVATKSNNTNGQNDANNSSNTVSSNSNQVVLGMKNTTLNSPNINGTKNVILNTNLNQKIKMTKVKNGTVLNLNTSKVVYKTINDLSQPQHKSINIMPSYMNTNNQSKQIIIQNNSQNSRLSTLINNNGTNNSTIANKSPSVIVISQQNQRINQNGQNTPNTIQYIIQQKSANQASENNNSTQQKPPVLISSNNSLLNNIKSGVTALSTNTSLGTNKIQNILEKSAIQNKELQNQQVLPLNLNNDLTNSPNCNQTNIAKTDASKNIIYALNNQNNQQIIKLNKPVVNNKPQLQNIPPPLATNSILKAHLNSETFLSANNIESKAKLLEFQVQIKQEQNQNLPCENNNQLKAKEIVKITPANSQKQNTQIFNINNSPHIQSILNSPANNYVANKPNDQIGNFQNRTVVSNVQENPKQITSRRNSKKNEMKTRRDSVTQNIDQNSVDCHCPAVEIPESTGSMDVNFLPGEDFLNDFLMPDTRIFASLLNKDLNNSKINNINVTNANNGAKKTYADLTYKTVMIGDCEHIILDNLNSLADYRGDFAKLQNLACAIANKFNKPVTIPSFLLMQEENAVANVKNDLNEKNIYPMIIDTNSENSDNATIPSNLLQNEIIFKNTAIDGEIKNQNFLNTDQTNVNLVEPKKEDSIFQYNNKNQIDSMKLNSQNHYLIKSLQSETKIKQQFKENQQQTQVITNGFNEQSLFADNSAIESPNSMQIKENKKVPKQRKAPIPKNPNTPKRRKTSMVSKEKINQMPINSIQIEAVTPSQSGIQTITTVATENKTTPQSLKKQRKPRANCNKLLSLSKVQTVNTGITPVINAIQTTTPTINQNIAFNNIQAIDPNIEATKQQNLQIQNIANDLLKVKDEIQNLSQQSNINILNTDNSFMNNQNQIQQIENNTSNLNNQVNINFINNQNKQTVLSNETAIGDNRLLTNNTNQSALNHNENMNEYDFSFDPFDSNVLFNLNDMEFI